MIRTHKHLTLLLAVLILLLPAGCTVVEGLFDKNLGKDIFTVSGEDALIFLKRTETELPVQLTFQFSGVGGTRILDITDPEMIRKVLNAMKEIRVSKESEVYAVDNSTDYFFTMADGTENWFPFNIGNLVVPDPTGDYQNDQYYTLKNTESFNLLQNDLLQIVWNLSH